MAKKTKQTPNHQTPNHSDSPLEGEALIKETCRRLRAAKSLWDDHRNAACRNEREKAIALYNQLTKAQKEQIPQQLRIWLRYRSEKYFGTHQTAPGSKHRSSKNRRQSGQSAANATQQHKSNGSKQLSNAELWEWAAQPANNASSKSSLSENT